MEIKKVGLTDMLQARDSRAERQRALLDRYSAPLISFTMNVAGDVKLDDLILQAFLEGVRRVQAQLQWHAVPVLEEHHTVAFTGCEHLWCVQADPASLKKWMQAVEEADQLGRIFDIDVIAADGIRLSRSHDRRCLICDDSARSCARSRKHPAQEVYLRTRCIIRQHFQRSRAASIAACAQQALLCEALVAPKPGLVDREDSGSHRDMDIFSFAISATALRSYFESCASVGMNGDMGGDPLEALRLLGRQAEQTMLQAAGANTHKGAIFSLGLLCCAAAMAGEEDLLSTAASLARPALDDLARISPDQARTGGEQQYLSLGLTGVRGEAAAGFPSVKNLALPALENALARGESINDAGLAAFLSLMAQVMDSNVIRRGGMSAQQSVHARAREMLDRGLDLASLRQLNADFIRENISPGGCADLLAAAYFLHFYSKTVENAASARKDKPVLPDQQPAPEEKALKEKALKEKALKEKASEGKAKS